MEAITNKDYSPDWVVMAEWYGSKRVVYSGDAFEVAWFVAENKDKVVNLVEDE